MKKSIFLLLVLVLFISCSTQQQKEAKKTIENVIIAVKNNNTELLFETAPFVKDYQQDTFDAYISIWSTILKNKYKITVLKSDTYPVEVTIQTFDQVNSPAETYIILVDSNNTIQEEITIIPPAINIDFIDFRGE